MTTTSLPIWQRESLPDSLKDLIEQVAEGNKPAILRVQNLLRDYPKEAMRQLCRSDLYTLATEILGYDRLTWRPSLYMPLCEWMMAWDTFKNKKLLLWPRHWFKTTVSTVADNIRLILNDQNTAILIQSGLSDNAEKMASDIKDQFENNTILQRLFPEICGKPGKPWGTDAFSVLRTKHRKEPTITAKGTAAKKTSLHFDWHSLDDAVDPENSKTEDGRMAQIMLWQRNIGLFDPLAKHKIVGTRFHDLELYGHMLKYGPETVDMNILDCFDENMESRFPELMTTERLMRMQGEDEMGMVAFSSLMRNSPLPAEAHDRFRDEDLMYYEPGQMPNLDGMVVGVVLDPGWSTTRFAHGHGIIAAAKDWADNFYVLGQYTDKQEGEATIEKTISIALKWNAQAIVVETTTAQKLFQERLQRIVAERQLHMQVIGVTTGRLDKITRIKSILLPPVQAHQIYLMRGMNEMREQLLRFPIGEKVDLVDALAHGYAGIPRPHKPHLTSIDKSETMNEEERDPTEYVSVPALMRQVDRRRRRVAEAARGW